MGLSSLPNAIAASLDEAARIELLRGLVAIPSTSGKERAAVEYLVDQMAVRGFKTSIDAAGNAIGRIGAGDRRIVLLGHIDTVPGDIPVRIENGELHGRGAVDAKGPLATFVCAAALAAERANAELIVVGAVGEESIGSAGATEVATWPAPDVCVIGEPSGWDALCLGYRGSLSLIYTVEQGGRHTAGPGESIGEKAVGFWNGLTAEIERRNEGVTGAYFAIGASLRSFNTSSDGLIDRAELSIGVRLPPGIDVDELQDWIERRIRESGAARLDILGRQEGYRTDKRSAVTAPFLRAIRAEGGTPRFTLKLGTSDMTVVGPAWGCPVVAYGPGDASLDHTPHERIVVEDYLRGVRVLAHALAGL